MLTVRILVGLAGTPYQPGEEIALPDDRANQFVHDGIAELVGAGRAAAGGRRPRTASESK